MHTRFYSLIAVLIIACSWMFIDLGKAPFVDYDEAGYAQVIADTEHASNIANLQFVNVDWFEKPPLYMWAAMISEKIFPDIEFAYRFPSALSALGCLILLWLLTFHLTRRTDIATATTVILLFTGAFLDTARMLRIDIPVTFAILLTYYGFVVGRQDERRYMLIGSGTGLGVMIKSIIGVFGLIPIFFYSLISRDFSWLKNKFVWMGALIGLVVSAPWHIYEWLRHGADFWKIYIGLHVVDRFTHNLFPTDVPALSLLEAWFGVSFPWSLIFAGTCLFALAYIWKNRMWLKEKVQTNEVTLVLFSSVLTVLLLLAAFSLAQTKAISYLIPVYPFMALSIGLIVHLLREQLFGQKLQKFKKLCIVCSCLLFIVALNTTYLISSHKHPRLNLYNYEQVHDEHQIGILLNNLQVPATETVYFFNQDYWETVRFYSQHKKFEGLTEHGAAFTASYYLIIPTHEQEKMNIPYSVIYAGKEFSLLRINPDTFAFKN